MPEGDTVWLTARRLREALAGRRLVVADLRVPQLATADLTGREVRDVTSRGKHLLTRLQGGWTLHTHLRMDGAWRVFRTGQRWYGGPISDVRAVLATEDRIAVGYRLPVVELLHTVEEETALGRLGPDLLAPDWGGPAQDEAVRRLSAEPARQIGEALLDQENLAGVGNVYKCELCFLRGVSPFTPVGEVERLDRMVGLAHRLLDANKARSGHVTTGDTRPGRRHWVYGRGGRPCLRCGTLVAAAHQGAPPRDRITYWCPTCQPDPPPP
ncbi:DNA glycosylase [Mangrovactinospora gilvigrisea]|uniref:DNA-(apurinic or apyrimidinic site) lyase n=1 Tax=Mangrovactinospora gilvigrisea TaxID=1428644 RepID=A0A1J7BGB8_9ACTN|nr:DNA-formamidopyrimidine glycosylase family protein [Mangrovactinospora gilvigrisea]OIV37719.1 DNA glycosylase [Mangrovactinospora gilvigrisea]